MIKLIVLALIALLSQTYAFECECFERDGTVFFKNGKLGGYCVPTESPTKAPTLMPTRSPSVEPTYKPTFSPTSEPTSNPTVCPTEVDLFFIIDASGTIKQSRFELMLDFVKNVLLNFNNKRVGIVSFSNRAVLTASMSDLYTDEELIGIIRNSRFRGKWTNLPQAVWLASNDIKKYDDYKTLYDINRFTIVITISDFKPETSTRRPHVLIPIVRDMYHNIVYKLNNTVTQSVMIGRFHPYVNFATSVSHLEPFEISKHELYFKNNIDDYFTKNCG